MEAEEGDHQLCALVIPSPWLGLGLTPATGLEQVPQPLASVPSVRRLLAFPVRCER